MKTREDVLLYVFLILTLVFLLSGCTPIFKISPSDNDYFHDQFNRSHPNPIPLPPTPRKIQ